MKAFFANSGHDLWLDVAYRLQNEYGWKILYLIGKDGAKEKAKRLFPGAVFHTNAEAKNGLAPTECPDILPYPADAEVLSALSGHEHLLLKMMDRLNADGSYTLQKRTLYYHWLVSYWLRVLVHFAPDIVVFRTAPHQPFDFALYAVTRYLGIKTLMFERTALADVVLPVVSYESEHDALIEEYRNRCATCEEQDVPSVRVRNYLDKMKGEYAEACPDHLQYKLNRFAGGELPSAVGIVASGLREMVSIIRNHGFSYERLRKQFYKSLGIQKKKALRNHYNALTQEVYFDKPYIFAAMQCEPERQAVPSGGWFSDQYLMVEALSAVIPNGWLIYVKEHVSQYKSYQHGELSRTKAFYDRMNALPNVVMVPFSVTSFDLIDNARASATISGSVAWESVVRGRPSLLFGHAWYKHCEGVFTVSSRDGLINAIGRIEEGYEVNAAKVTAFLGAVEAQGTVGYIDEVYLSMNIGTEEHRQRNVNSFVESINDFCQG